MLLALFTCRQERVLPGNLPCRPGLSQILIWSRKRHLKAAWTELVPVSKVMPVTSSGAYYFGHTECETIEPQGPTELRSGVPTASCSSGERAGYWSTDQ